MQNLEHKIYSIKFKLQNVSAIKNININIKAIFFNICFLFYIYIFFNFFFFLNLAYFDFLLNAF